MLIAIPEKRLQDNAWDTLKENLKLQNYFIFFILCNFAGKVIGENQSLKMEDGVIRLMS